MSAYHLSPDNILAYLGAMQCYGVRYIWGYASALYALAQTVLERDLAVPALEVAISNAEPLYEHQRKAIEQAFGCPVRNTYGMAEAVCAASECKFGNMHLWPEAGVLEVFDDEVDESVTPGEVGRFICTGLANADMLLIRYEIGDRGAIASPDEVCDCGRNLPLLQKVEGRMDDVILTPDGRRIGRLDPIFKADMPIREAQIIQERLDLIRLLVVPTLEYTDIIGELIIQRLRDRVGDIEVDLEVVADIPRTENGKFRAVISHVDK